MQSRLFQCFILFYFILFLSFQFTLKVKVESADEEELVGTTIAIAVDGTNAGDDSGTTTDGGILVFDNKGNKFKYGSTIVLTLSKTGYLAKVVTYEFMVSELEEQELPVTLNSEGIVSQLKLCEIHLRKKIFQCMNKLKVARSKANI